MPAHDGPKEPSRPTVKRLFAVSGNRCAFPKCSTQLVDKQSGSVVGEMCHIKGEKPGAARYDSNQSNEERHNFENLILLCNVHHKIVDDDEVAYTVERLRQMKLDHESRNTDPPHVNEATVEQFISVAINSTAIHRDMVASYGQSGGQTAHSINNYYGQAPSKVFCIATHIGTHESVDVSQCERHGRPVAPSWFQSTPQRIGSGWIVERLTAQADLQLYFDPKWCGGTWFMVDVQRGDGEVLNLDQLGDLRPSSVTTTTTTTQPPDPYRF